MKEKYGVFVFAVFVFCFMSMFLFTGCEKSLKDNLQNSKAEIVENYFFAKGETFSCSISSGEREEPYSYDGRAEDMVDFSILTIFFQSPSFSILADVFINEKKRTQTLAVNPINGHYICDLKVFLKIDDKIEICFNDETLELKPLSKDFEISFEKAFVTGVEFLSSEIENLFSKDVFQVEIYLRVLEIQDNNFDQLFWYFGVIGKNKTNFYCIIDTQSGKIIQQN